MSAGLWRYSVFRGSLISELRVPSAVRARHLPKRGQPGNSTTETGGTACSTYRLYRILPLPFTWVNESRGLTGTTFGSTLSETSPFPDITYFMNVYGVINLYTYSSKKNNESESSQAQQMLRICTKCRHSQRNR